VSVLEAPISWSAPDFAVIIVATITAVATVIAAIIASRRSNARPKSSAPLEPLSTFSGTQNEFTALVIADNKQLREDQAALEKRVGSIETTIADERKAANAYRAAMRRYLQKILDGWRSPEPMPLPDDADMELLSQTLPNFGRRRKQS
jgi:hypothetical protein